MAHEIRFSKFAGILVAAVGFGFVACESPKNGEIGTTSSSSSSSSSSGGGGSAGAGGNASGGSGGGAAVPPVPPPELVHYVTGNDADAEVTPVGPGLILMGGGTDVDEAFVWWKPLLAGGDVVILRSSGADGYNDYLYSQIGGFDSVETLLVTSKDLANDAYVQWRVSHAEGVFLAGGDQSNYVTFWRDTALSAAITEVYQRGGVIGGTSAGCAVLGQFLFPAYAGSVTSDEALLDPYNQYMTLEKDFFSFSPLAGFITDTHFVTRDRMGRLVGFLGRILTDGWAPAAFGLGIDEHTAVVIGAAGNGEILGSGKVYLVRASEKPAVCSKGMPLEYSGLTYERLGAGDMISFPSGTTNVMAEPISASGGVTSPMNPY